MILMMMIIMTTMMMIEKIMMGLMVMMMTRIQTTLMDDRETFKVRIYNCRIHSHLYSLETSPTDL